MRSKALLCPVLKSRQKRGGGGGRGCEGAANSALYTLPSPDCNSEPQRGEWLGVAPVGWGSGRDPDVSRRKRPGLGRQVRVLEAAPVQG